MKNLLILLALSAALHGQGTGPPGPQRSATNPVVKPCTVGSSGALLYNNAGVDTIYTAQGSPCVYAPNPSGSITTLTPDGIGVGGVATANKLTGPANVLVATDGSGDGAAATIGAGLGFTSNTLSLQPPTLSSIGGVQAVNTVSHQWLAYIDTSGVPHLTQPNYSDLAGTNPAAAGAALGTTSVQVPVTSTQTTAGPLYANQSQIGVYSADNWNALLPSGVWRGTWSSATAYNAGDAVNNGTSGQNYIALQASTNQALPTYSQYVPTLYWTRVSENTASYVPTPADVGWYTQALLNALTNNSAVFVKYGNANYSTCAGFQEPDSSTAVVNMEGTYHGSAGVGVGNHFGTLITATCGMGFLHYNPPKSLGAAIANPVLANIGFSQGLSGSTGAGSCFSVVGAIEAYYHDLFCANGPQGSFEQIQIGSSTCTGMFNCNAIQSYFENIYDQGYGSSAWAVGTATANGDGTISVAISNVGVYRNSSVISPLIKAAGGVDPTCTVVGVPVAVFTSTGVTSVTTTSYSGCTPGQTLYLQVPDISNRPYGINVEFATDSTFVNIKSSQNGLECIRNIHGQNRFYSLHPFTCPVLFDDAGSNNDVEGLELDNPLLSGLKLSASGPGGNKYTMAMSGTISGLGSAPAVNTVWIQGADTSAQIALTCVASWSSGDHPGYALFNQANVALASGNPPSQLTGGLLSMQDCVTGNYLNWYPTSNARINLVASSATPAFNLALGTYQTNTLTNNVTSSTATSLTAGQQSYFKLTENSTGGFTYVWPTNIKGVGQINTAANAVNVVGTSCFDASNCYATGPVMDQNGNGYFAGNVFAGGQQSAIGFSSAAVTLTPGTNITSVTCTSATCDVNGGSLSIVGGALASTGTFATVSYTAIATAPRVCMVAMNGGATFLGLGHGTPSTTSFTLTSAISVAATTFTMDYQCKP